jgi:hypothetical protein
MAVKTVETQFGPVEVRRNGHAPERTVIKDGRTLGRIVKRHGEKVVVTPANAPRGVLVKSINAGVYFLVTLDNATAK